VCCKKPSDHNIYHLLATVNSGNTVDRYASFFLPNELVEPAENFVVPLETGVQPSQSMAASMRDLALPVTVLEHPVILVREDQETARDTTSRTEE
jgi:hypothetical protein